MRAFVFLCLLACATDEGDSGSGGIISAEDAAAVDVWDEIQGYEEWEQHADWTGIVASEDGTHGDYVSIWMNDIAASAINAGDGGEMPEGAILVKEGYLDAEGTEFKGLTVMKKEAGWGDSGWFWAKYDPENPDPAQLAGEVSACSGCHAGGQDSVLFATW